MKILIVTPDYSRNAGGGVGTVARFLVDLIATRAGWTAEIASLQMSRTASQSRRILDPRSWFRRSRAARTEDDAVTVFQVGAAIAELEFTRFLPRRWLDALIQRADVVVVVSGTPAAALVARRTSKPVMLYTATLIHWERDAQVRAARNIHWLYRRLMLAIVSRFDRQGIRVPSRVLVLNEKMLSWARAHASGDVILAIPGTDTTRFVPGVRTTSDPYLLFVGRMSDSRKNIGGLLRAYANYRRASSSPRRLVLAGLTPPLAEDAALIATLGLTGYVEVRSPLGEDELVRLIQGATLFVSATHEEGLGITFIEALACGVPVITTATDGAQMIIRDGVDGVLVPLGADMESALGEAILLWEDVPDSTRESCRARAETMFSLSAVSDSVLRAIESLAVVRPEPRHQERSIPMKSGWES